MNGDCIQTPNYPSDYDNSDTCRIRAEQDMTLSVLLFDTEGCCDTLEIAERSYSGSLGPDGLVVSAATELTWTTNSATSDPGWRICAEPPPAPTPSPAGNKEDSSGGSLIIIVVVVVVLVVLVVCAGVFFFFKKGSDADKVTPVVAAAAEPEPVGKKEGDPEKRDDPVKPQPMLAPVAKADDDPNQEPDEENPQLAKGVLPDRTGAVKLDVAQGGFPPYWIHKAPPDFNMNELTGREEMEMLQKILDTTFKRVKTRDRKSGGMPTHLRLVSAQRIENSKLWMKYAEGRAYFKNKRPHKCTPLEKMGGESLVDKSLLPQMRRDLNGAINETYLLHGTSPQGAMGIAAEGFKIRFAGSMTGTMYGRGVYLAECCSKSDEYAVDDQIGMNKGLFCLLLCRTVLGEVLHLTAGGDATHLMIKAGIEGGAYDSVLGDRDAAVATYREFVVYGEDQVYPEYLIVYAREF